MTQLSTIVDLLLKHRLTPGYQDNPIDDLYLQAHSNYENLRYLILMIRPNNNDYAWINVFRYLVSMY